MDGQDFQYRRRGRGLGGRNQSDANHIDEEIHTALQLQLLTPTQTKKYDIIRSNK